MQKKIGQHRSKRLIGKVGKSLFPNGKITLFLQKKEKKSHTGARFSNLSFGFKLDRRVGREDRRRHAAVGEEFDTHARTHARKVSPPFLFFLIIRKERRGEDPHAEQRRFKILPNEEEERSKNNLPRIGSLFRGKRRLDHRARVQRDTVASLSLDLSASFVYIHIKRERKRKTHDAVIRSRPPLNSETSSWRLKIFEEKDEQRFAFLHRRAKEKRDDGRDFGDLFGAFWR
jgi:hypothetical protein